MAQKAVIEECEVNRIHNHDKLFAVTSAREAALVYVVDVQDGTCTCEGFARWQVCRH